MGLFAQFGVESGSVGLALNLLLLFAVVLWVALVYWTYADARRRIADPMLVACATLASVLGPFVGTIVYLIVRPPEYLADVHERELEVAAAEARVAQLEELACPYCDFEIEPSFLRCPSCLRRLKEPCHTCGKPLDPRWKICPYCESEIAGQTPRRRAARPSARTASAAARGGERPSRSEAASRGESGARRESARPPAGGEGASRPAARPQGAGDPSARTAAAGATRVRPPAEGGTQVSRADDAADGGTGPAARARPAGDGIAGSAPRPRATADDPRTRTGP